MSATHFSGPVYVGGVEVAGLASAASTFAVTTDLTVGGTAAVTGAITGASFAGAVSATTLATSGKLSLAVAAKTAGVTQTQAGATAITSTITLGTTGNANDGYLLPAMTAGAIYIIHNLSANAGKVYANSTETLNGTAGNAGSTALTASKTMLVFGTGAGTSVSAVMM